MIAVGLTGGISSGKSTVSKMLTGLGAMIIDLDLVAREVVEPEKPAWRQIVDYFGPGILLPDGSLNRGAIAQRIFQDPEARQALNSFTHPAVIERTAATLAEWRQRYPGRVAVVDGPLLLEAGMQYLVEEIWVVWVDIETQIQRVMTRDGIGREEAQRRIAAQMPLEEKLLWATRVIDNRGSLEDTYRQVEAYWNALQQKLETGGCP